MRLQTNEKCCKITISSRGLGETIKPIDKNDGPTNTSRWFRFRDLAARVTRAHRLVKVNGSAGAMNASIQMPRLSTKTVFVESRKDG